MNKEYCVEYLIDNELIQVKCDLVSIEDLMNKNVEIKRYFWR